MHRAILDRQLTATQLVGYYLKRIEAYNGPCVRGAIDPASGKQLGDIEPIANAGKVNALITLNLRGKRSETDKTDNNPAMPDALEAAAQLDAEFAATGKLKGPLHGIPFAIKDQFDTADMRTTSGAAARYANDRPPKDATVVARLRAAGAIILGKSNLGEYASGDRSTHGGTTCNPYDTTRSAGRSSGGSGAAVAANLVMCALGEETGPSARNPASNGSLVGIVATNSLVSRAGIVPASLTRDRAGVLCRSVKDAATVLSVLAGYDPRDPATAESPRTFLVALRRLCRQRHAHRRPHRRRARIHAGSHQGRRRRGPHRRTTRCATWRRQERRSSIRVPRARCSGMRSPRLCPRSTRPRCQRCTGSCIATGMPFVDRTVQLSGNAGQLPPELTIRLLAEREPQVSGEVLYALDRYLRDRGDANIKTRARSARAIDLLRSCADRRRHASAAERGSRVCSNRLCTLTRKSDNAPMVQKFPVATVDITAWHAVRTTLQMLVNKVMADNRLDALVYPTKTIPAPLLASPGRADHAQVGEGNRHAHDRGPAI